MKGAALPYITREERAEIDPAINALAERIDGSAGTLNYVLTRLVLDWIGGHPSYGSYNAAVGVLECAKLELVRTQLAKYEDMKRVQNGAVLGAIW